MLGMWPCPGGGELALSFDRGGPRRVLVLPALFEESNKLRHFTVEVMRALDRAGIDSFLPDLAGCNESLAPLSEQTIAGWQEQSRIAAQHFAATHILTIRGGALLDPGDLPGRRYAPVEGGSLLRNMLRARILSDREAGVTSERDALLEQGKADGITLAGYSLGPDMLAALETAPLPRSAAIGLAQSAIGGGGLWLRSEPSHDPDQAEKLAALVAEGIG